MAKKRRKTIVRDPKKTAVRIAAAAVSVIALIGAVVLAVFLAKSCGVKLTSRELQLADPDMICGTGDGLLYLRFDQLGFISYTDQDNDFTKPVTGVSAPVGIVGSSGVKAVYSNNSIQIIGGGFDVGVEGSIEAVRCGAAHLAICFTRPNGSVGLNAYTSAGQLIKSFDFEKGRLVDFGFGEHGGASLWTMELDTDSGSSRTTISTFDLQRMSSTGVITVSDQLVERIFFTDSSVFVVGTESLIRYSASANREIYRVQLYGYRVADITLSGGSPMLMLVPRRSESDGSVSSIRLLTVSQKDVAEETAVTVTVPEGVIGCHLCSGSLAMVSASEVELYSGKGVSVEKETLPPGATVSCKKLDEHHILMERSGEFVLLTVGK